MKRTGIIIFTTLLIFQLANAQKRDNRNTMSNSLNTTILNQINNENELLLSHLDSIKTNAAGDVEFNEDDVLVARRIQRIQKTVPLEYNDRVKAYLDKYISKNYKPYMEKLLGLSQYYFPIYEQIFAETGIPDEVKFLSVVESSLDPQTLSTSGALGPWQFIYPTAKIYNLTMDSYLDERKDAFSTTYAVSQYINEAYHEFNDWLLALASYNCGRGCVRRAIQRSGLHNPTYWELSPYLPQETRNYIPKYIAMTYVLNHAEEYDLIAKENQLQCEYKVLMVDKHVDIRNIAKAVDYSVDVLQQFNPAYKRNIVNGTPESPRRLIVPYHEGINDSLLYLALNNQNVPAPLINEIDESKYASTHQVKSGETLTAISKKYGVSIQNLRTWNGLSEKSSISGKTLIVSKDPDTRLASNVSKAKKVESTSSKYVVHTVRKGDTLSGIASKYKGSTISKLRADNNIKGSHLAIGAKIKVNQGKG